MWAVENDDMDSLRILLDAGADVSVRVLGKTVLDMAKQKGNTVSMLTPCMCFHYVGGKTLVSPSQCDEVEF